jgi:hypothetical protein
MLGFVPQPNLFLSAFFLHGEGIVPGNRVLIKLGHYNQPKKSMVKKEESLCGGLTQERRAWLCLPEQIENTMRLLSFVNYWAKSRDRLLYSDRQGLYEVKAAILETTYRKDLISPTAYISGLPDFLEKLWDVDSAAEMVAEVWKENWEFEEQELSASSPPPEMSVRKCPRCRFFAGTISERFDHWHSQHSQAKSALKSHCVSWIFFGSLNKEKLFASLELPEPNTELPINFSKSEKRKKRKLEKQGLTYTLPKKPAWSWEIIKDFIDKNQPLIQQLEKEVLAKERASFEAKLRQWEKQQKLAEKLRQEEKVGTALALNLSVARLEELMSSEGKEEELKKAIACQLQAIVDEAIQNRQPLNTDALQGLQLSPIDFVDFDGIYRFWPSWDELKDSDLRKLDPEGYSLLAFEYRSEQSHFIFHLPLRIAEEFVAPEELEELIKTQSNLREVGEFYGREITEAEALEFPIDLILQELGVSIVSVCPEGLIDKEEYVNRKALSRPFYYEDWDDDEEED